MKKYISLLILLFSAAQSLTAQSFSDDNFIHTVSPRKPVGAAAFTTLGKTDKTQQVTYFDGLGRPVQTTEIGHGGDGADIVTPVEYDVFGRQQKDYLPYALVNTTTSYPRIALTASQTSLGSLYNTAKYDYTTKPFAEKLLEPSPLNRVLKQAAPGVSWEMGSGHEVKLEYLANEAADVKLYKALAAWNSTAELYDISISDAGSYSAGELYKYITYDENTAASPSEGAGTTIEFKNKEGQLVLKRAFGTVGAGTVNEKHDTYYVYDIYGNLTYVLPPKAEGIITAAVLNDLCYQYKYDYRNRMVEKKLPGKQWEFIVYDKLDRVVATGPANSPFNNLTSSGWLITKYDAFNRPVITGWMPAASVTTADRTAIQKDRNKETLNFNEAKSSAVLTVNSVDIRYTNSVWPVNSSTAPVSIYHILAASYYDNYDYPGAPAAFGTVAGQQVFYNNTVKPVGLATGSWTRILESSTSPIRAESSYALYDNKDRVIRSYAANLLGGYTQIDTNIDFLGKTIYTLTTHQRVSGGAVNSIRDDYAYTDQDLLESVTQTIGGSQQLLSYNTYDILGQLESKKIGNTQAAPLQVVDYTYNVRGWLKGINNVNQLAKGTAPKDLFAFQISYNDISDPSKRLFNGNISQTIWASDNADKSIRNYVYTYDGLNRLKSAVDNAGLFTEDNIQFDKNGNIIKLQRKGAVVPNPSVSVAANYALMDDLTYSYDSGNRLMKVADAAAADQYGFKDDALNTAVDTADDYSYDANGNMLTDTNKGITANITYNHLNLPVKIIFPTGNITYLYNAAGQKVQKTVIETSSANTTTTEYLDGFQYKRVNLGTAELQFFPTQEGYAANKAGVLSYVFQYKDHLGNVRLSYAKNASSGLDIIEENNYYAFGLEHQGYNNVPQITFGNAAAEQYKYNGKEFQDENIGGWQLNLYDYGARNYDPALGRWINIDPLTENAPEWSAYRYGYNNPLRFIDPSGMLETDYLDVSTGELTNINDGKDQVIAATTSQISKAKENFANNKNQYNKDLAKKENSSSNLNLSRSQFMFLAETLYAESSGSFGETLGIVNVLENRAKNQGNSFMDQLSADTPYGVYGVWKTSGGKDSKYEYAYQNESGAGVENKKLNIHRAIATGLMTSLDVTKGAYFWDGTDITTNSHYLKWGLKFSNPGHNLWKLKETSGTHQLISTRAIDKTTFSKFKNQGTIWSTSN